MAIPGLPGGLIIYQGNPSIAPKRTPMALAGNVVRNCAEARKPRFMSTRAPRLLSAHSSKTKDLYGMWHSDSRARSDSHARWVPSFLRVLFRWGWLPFDALTHVDAIWMTFSADLTRNSDRRLLRLLAWFQRGARCPGPWRCPVLESFSMRAEAASPE